MTSMKVVVRVARVLNEIHMSSGFSMAMSEDTGISPGLIDSILVAPVDHG
jgi:hypothetical protein